MHAHAVSKPQVQVCYCDLQWCILYFKQLFLLIKTSFALQTQSSHELKAHPYVVIPVIF